MNLKPKYLLVFGNKTRAPYLIGFTVINLYREFSVCVKYDLFLYIANTAVKSMCVLDMLLSRI